MARVCGISGSADTASVSPPEIPGLMVAMVGSMPPPRAPTCRAASASTTGRCDGVRWPRSTRWSARGRAWSVRPGLEGVDELGLVDHPVLQGEQPEEEVGVDV